LPPENIRNKIEKERMARQIAYREALREAMVEEMRRDERVFLMGEEVAEYNGAYKVSQGMLAEFGPRRVIDHAHIRIRICGSGCGSSPKWFATHC
jgi:pyruvate dehydrogenase E1 component beta subunit